VYWPPATQLPAEAHDTEKTLADPPAFSAPDPGTSVAGRQVPARATAHAAGAAVTASGAVHHTAAAPAKTITTRCRLIGSPHHVPARPVRQPGRPVQLSPLLVRKP
jgi:hypothetical protein